MSTAHFIACDHPLPKVDLRAFKAFPIRGTTMEFSIGFAVEPVYHDNEGFISKNYVYEIYLEAHSSCVEHFQRYLIKNMKNESEVEVWSIRVGGDYTKHYKTKVHLNHIPSKDIAIVYDSIDWYTEHHIVPNRKYVYVRALAIDDIAFVLDNLSVCLVIRK